MSREPYLINISFIQNLKSNTNHVYQLRCPKNTKKALAGPIFNIIQFLKQIHDQHKKLMQKTCTALISIFSDIKT